MNIYADRDEETSGDELDSCISTFLLYIELGLFHQANSPACPIRSQIFQDSTREANLDMLEE